MKPVGMTLCIVVLLACICLYIESDGNLAMQGNILYVGGSGPGNYSSVQEALDAAADGDTVYVYDDSSPYSERVVVTASIHLTGENRTTTIIDGGGMGSVVTIAAPDVVVSNLTVRDSGANGSTRGGILLECTGCIVRNVVLRDNEYGVICRGDGHHVAANLAQQNIGGVYLQDATGCLIVGNVLDGNQLMGIALLQDTADNIIKNNRVMNGSTGQGLLVGGTGNRIEGNVVSDQQYGGLQLLSSGNVVVNNSFYGCGLGTMYDYQSNVLHGNMVNGKPLVYLEDTSDVTVEHAGQVFLIHCTDITVQGLQLSNTTVAVQLFESSKCHILDNEISGNLAGVMLWNASDNTISGNGILDNVFEGVNVGPFSHRTQITGNVISRNNRGVSLWSEENTVTDNTISGNWNGVQLDLSSHNSITVNLLANNTEGVSLWQESHDNAITDNSFHSNIRAVSLHYENTGNVISSNEITGSEYGVDISPSSNSNDVLANTFTGNEVGVWIGSTGNVIRYNNFYDSERRDATFISADREPLVPHNRWTQNYWGRPHMLPKPIFGWRLPFPWLNFDWRPLMQPYDG